MSSMSQAKGCQWERDVADLARAHGFSQARRTFFQPGATGADISGVPGLAIEAKRAERVSLQAWWKQAQDAAGPGEMPCVALRWSRGPALGVIPLDELFALWAARTFT